MINSDEGWLLESRKEISKISYKLISTDYSLISNYQNDDKNKNIYGSVNFYLNKNYVKYIRKYEKIQTLAANVGGILKIFTFLLAILNQFYSN